MRSNPTMERPAEASAQVSLAQAGLEAVERLRAAAAEGTPAPAELKDLRGMHLVGADLSGMDLSGCDLSGADLSRADLSGARLLGADLTGATLFETNLEGAECLSANFTRANLSECKAPRIGLGACDLREAVFFQADMRDGTFTKADLRGADLRGANLASARLCEAQLAGAEFGRANLRGTDLDQSDVEGAGFVDCDLRDSRMRGMTGYSTANWIEADINGVDFCGAYLVRRTILDQNYLHEFRTHSRTNAMLYQVWWITSDCGRSFLRWGLWTVLLAAVYAGLYEMTVIDYGDYETPLSSIYYSVVTLTTLGYGDVLPANTTAQLLAMSQVILGYVMLGGLLSIFSNKMARRAD